MISRGRFARNLWFMANIERRPHLRRPCPLQETHHCDWWQVTSWFVGGPDRTEAVSDVYLRLEAEAHLTAHFTGTPGRIFL